MDITPKPDRAGYLLFTKPYLNVPHIIVARSGGLFYKREEHLQGHVLALEKGFGNVSYFREKFPRVEVVEYPDTTACLEAVSKGEADAYAGNRAVAAYIIARDLLTNLEIQGTLKKQGSVLTIGVRKDWPQLAALLNKALAAVSLEEVREIHLKWTGLGARGSGSLLEGLTPPEMQFLRVHTLIRVGVNPGWMPFDYLDSLGHHAGISSDYLGIIGKLLKVELRPVPGLAPDRLLAEVRAGRIDLLGAVIPTEENRKDLIITAPYLKMPLVLITRDDTPYITGIREIRRGSLALVRGRTDHDQIIQDYPEGAYILVADQEQAFRAVSQGEALATVDTLASLELVKRRLGLENLKASAPTEYVLDIAMGIRRDWPRLASIMNKALASFTGHEKTVIQDKWINVTVERRVDWGVVFKTGARIGFGVMVVVALILFWNRSLAKQVEQRKEAEERFRVMAANVPGTIFQVRAYLDGRTKYLFLSERAQELFEVPPEQVIRENLSLTFHPEDGDRVQEETRLSFSRADEVNIVARIIMADGRIKWIRISASPRGSAGEELIYNGFMLDITDRKTAELEYLASERKIKAMSRAVEDALVMIDGEDRILFWNQAAERLFGYSEEEALGLEFHPLAVPEEDLEKALAGMNLFARTGRGDILGVSTELIARNRQGEHFPVEVMLSSFQVDQQWYAVGTVRDISERKQAEELLRESQNRLDMALEASNTGLWDWRPLEGRDYHNDQWYRQLGYRREDFKETEEDVLAKLMHQDDQVQFQKYMGSYLSGRGDEYRQDFRLKAKDGSWRSILSLGRVVERDDAGRARRILGVHLDMTSQKKAERELKRNLEDLERFSRLVVGREEKMIRLKEEVNILLEDLGRRSRYKIVQ